MAFATSLAERVDDLRFQSPMDEPAMLAYPSLRGNGGARMPHPSPQASDPRATLQRRFTTESAKLPSIGIIGTIGQQRAQLAEPLDLSSSTLHKVQLLEKKRQEYEMLKEQRRRFAAEMKLIDLQQRRGEQEILEMAESLGRVNSAGHQSEPTTPPEYTDSGFPTVLSRPNRYSTSSLISPPTFGARAARSASQITSPPSEEELPTSHRSAATRNRYSMPVTGLSFSSLTDSQDHSSATSFGPVNTSDYLLQEDEGERSSVKKDVSTTSPDVHSYLQVHATSDKFPILVTSKDMPGLLSASSAALDLALSQSPGPESQQNGWPSFARHRQGQQSLPMNSLTLSQSGSMGSSINSNNNPSSGASHSYNRKSLDLPGYSIYNDKPPAGKAVSSPIAQATPPKLQASFSTNDIPTVKSSNGLSIGSPTPNNHAHQHFQNHNASLGRIPPNGVNNRLSRDLSATDIAGAISKASTSNGYPSFQSALHPNAAPFGPTISNALVPQTMQITPSVPAVPYGPGNYYGNYQLGINPNMQMNNPQLFIPSPTPYQLYTFPKPESHAKVLQQRRTTDGEAMNRFTNVKLEDLRGEIYQLCKDQHGCRYLQKKLEERSASNIHIIFLETNDHVVELMTDPFGNYLCQKLLEYTGDDERTILINNAAPHLVTIALNQHGTRALQKMIEFISTEEQITTIMYALRDKVVELIQDLNGNHVIQKCLNRLSSADAQFIFDAVASHCVAVGTHRHGCCVLQRCVDHATGVQKANLINAISENSIALVQDPFGNYVVQYILDLHEPMFTEPLLKHFKGQIATLSMQKFSSNVIEKCIRCAKPETRISMIEEIMVPADLEKLLRDPFANYVVQTAMDHGDEATKVKLIDNIRPFLPSIRTLSYGRRIQGKIQDRDDHLATINGTAQTNPNTGTAQGKAPVRANLGSNNHRNNQHHAQNQNQNQIQGQGNMNNNNQQNFMNNGGKFSNNNGYGRSNAGAGGSGANSSLANSGTSTPSQPLIAQHQFSGNGLPQQSGIGHMEINPNMMHQAFFNSFGPGGPINGPGPSNPPPNYF